MGTNKKCRRPILRHAGTRRASSVPAYFTKKASREITTGLLFLSVTIEAITCGDERPLQVRPSQAKRCLMAQERL